jgi:hypothetical protein
MADLGIRNKRSRKVIRLSRIEVSILKSVIDAHDNDETPFPDDFIYKFAKKHFANPEDAIDYFSIDPDSHLARRINAIMIARLLKGETG